jgi:hypothetical protein
MEQRDVPIRLTAQEFDAMMREFDVAGGWMLQQIRQKRQVMPSVDTLRDAHDRDMTCKDQTVA